jgi:ubiquinol-cytochrome c reductase cytochrome b subunit
LFGAIPYFGEDLAQWIRGDYVISDATLNRFFAFHVIAVPLALIALIYLHVVALHKVGSNNPEGVEIKDNKDSDGVPVDGIPFHPYYTVKDIVGVGVFLLVFSVILFYMPEMGGFFLERENFIPADTLTTPEHIVPVWYFTPFYAILRAVPYKFGGVLALGCAVLILFVLPWLDRSNIKSIRYRSKAFKYALSLFTISFIVLGYLGTQPATPVAVIFARIFTVLYFGFFLLMPFYTRNEKATGELPERLTCDPPLDEVIREKHWPGAKRKFLEYSVMKEVKAGSGKVYKVPVLNFDALLTRVRERFSNTGNKPQK